MKKVKRIMYGIAGRKCNQDVHRLAWFEDCWGDEGFQVGLRDEGGIKADVYCVLVGDFERGSLTKNVIPK